MSCFDSIGKVFMLHVIPPKFCIQVCLGIKVVLMFSVSLMAQIQEAPMHGGSYKRLLLQLLIPCYA